MINLLAFILGQLGQVSAIIKFSFEQLHRNDGKYKVKQHVNDEYVFDIFQRIDHTIKHGLFINQSLIILSFKNFIAFTFNLGTRLIVLSGLNTRNTFNDLIVFKFLPLESVSLN